VGAGVLGVKKGSLMGLSAPARGAVGVLAPSSLLLLLPCPPPPVPAAAPATADKAAFALFRAAPVRHPTGSMASPAPAAVGLAPLHALGRIAEDAPPRKPPNTTLPPLSAELGFSGAGENAEEECCCCCCCGGGAKSHPLREEGGVGGELPHGSLAPPPAALPVEVEEEEEEEEEEDLAAMRAAWRASLDCTLLRVFSLSRVAAACTAARSGEVKTGLGGRVGEKSAGAGEWGAPEGGADGSSAATACAQAGEAPSA